MQQHGFYYNRIMDILFVVFTYFTWLLNLPGRDDTPACLQNIVLEFYNLCSRLLWYNILSNTPIPVIGRIPNFLKLCLKWYTTEIVVHIFMFKFKNNIFIINMYFILIINLNYFWVSSLLFKIRNNITHKFYNF